MKNQAVVIYGTTVEKITSVLDSGVLEGCKIVSVCTDELDLEDSETKTVPTDTPELDAKDEIVEEASDFDSWMPECCKIVDVGTDELDLEGSETTNLPTDLPESDVSDEIVEDSSEDSSVENSVVESDAPNQEEAETAGQSIPRFSDEQAEAMRGILTTWFEKMYQAVNNTKNKDTSIYNINKELQKFKDGYYVKLTSPIISEMITLREDYKKSIEDYSKFSLNYEKQVSYLECTIDQIDEILATYDVEVVDGKYLYSGKAIYPMANNDTTEAIVFEHDYSEIEKETYTVTDDVNEIVDCASLEQFLTRETANIETILRSNEALIKSVEIQNLDLKKQIAVTDGLLIIPLLRKIIRMRLTFATKREMIENFKEEAEVIYKEAYEYGIKYAESILISLGVSIRSNIDDTYDPKYHRILKMQKLLPEEAEKDKRIATFITDCYVNSERVVAPAKVIVYRL